MSHLKCEVSRMEPTGDTGDGLLARKIGDMNKGVVERRVDVCHAKDKLAIRDLGAERNGRLLLGCLNFLGGLSGYIQTSALPSISIHAFSPKTSSSIAMNSSTQD